MTRKLCRAFIVLSLTFGLAHADEILDPEQQNQVDSIKRLVKRLAEPFDLHETITVIARIESNFGLYVINLSEGSCGITQINLKTYMKRHNIKNTAFNRNRACSDLVNSPELSVANSIEELLYWKSQFCNKKTLKCTAKQYENVIRAYNGGFRGYRGKQTAEYYEKFKTYHRELFPATPNKKDDKPKAK